MGMQWESCSAVVVWKMQVRREKHDGASEVSARVRLPDGIHQFLPTQVGYGNGLPLVCIMQIRSEKRHGGIGT